jgi:hypothetical protein
MQKTRIQGTTVCIIVNWNGMPVTAAARFELRTVLTGHCMNVRVSYGVLPGVDPTPGEVHSRLNIYV